MKKKASMILLVSVLSLGTMLAACSSGTPSKSTAASSTTANSVAPKKEEPKYPTKQIEMTVPFAAGGGTDLFARAMGDYLNKEWGQQFVIVNKAGASGATGTQAFLSGSKDGHSILTQSSSGASGLLAGNTTLPFKVDDFQFLVKIAADPLAYVVQVEAPWKDINQFSDWVKKNPDQLTYASSGPASIGTIGMIQLLNSIGADFSKARRVTTNGTGDALPKVAGGHITVMTAGVSEVAGLVKAGKVKILGIASKEKSPFFPEVPTMEEQGIKGITAALWYGFSAPAGTPDYVVKKWESTFESKMKDPAFLEILKKIHVVPSYMNSVDYTAFVKKEINDFAAVKKQAE